MEAQNTARDYVNNLSSGEYDKLASQYDLHNELDEPSDPAELLSQFKQSMADTGKRPGVIEAVPAEDVTGKPQKITNAADLGRFKAKDPRYADAADAGTSLDKNTEEFRKQVAKYADPSSVTPKSKITLEDAQATEDNTWKGAISKFKEMMQDEGGGGKVPGPLRWMVKQAKDFTSPDADPATEEYGNSFREYGGTLPGEFQALVKRVKQLQMDCLLYTSRCV